jgi:nucleoside-diphosphate kinase
MNLQSLSQQVLQWLTTSGLRVLLILVLVFIALRIAKVVSNRLLSSIEKKKLEKHYPDSMAESIGSKAKRAVPEIKDPTAHGMNVLIKLREYFSRGSVLAIKFSGENTIARAREITGYTDPSEAKEGTVRGDLGVDSIEKSTDENRAVENLVHASGNQEEARTEIKLWLG